MSSRFLYLQEWNQIPLSTLATHFRALGHSRLNMVKNKEPNAQPEEASSTYIVCDSTCCINNLEPKGQSWLPKYCHCSSLSTDGYWHSRWYAAQSRWPLADRPEGIGDQGAMEKIGYSRSWCHRKFLSWAWCAPAAQRNAAKELVRVWGVLLWHPECTLCFSFLTLPGWFSPWSRIQQTWRQQPYTLCVGHDRTGRQAMQTLHNCSHYGSLGQCDEQASAFLPDLKLQLIIRHPPKLQP